MEQERRLGESGARRFLLRALSPLAKDAYAARIDDGGVDWEAVVELASRHLVTPALYRSLATKDQLDGLPEEVRSYLKAVDELNGGRNRRILAQLEEIVPTLTGAGIRTVLLKGAAHLADDLYGDPAARLIGDIDILVPSRQADDAVETLVGIGYRETDCADTSFYKDHHHQAPLVRDDEVACVEVHRAPTRAAFAALVPAADVLNEARPASLGTVPVEVPAARHQMVLNLVHAQLAHRSYWLGEVSFRALSDLARLRTRFDDAIDWPEIFATFDRAGHGTALRGYLLLAERLLGQAVPPGHRSTPGARFACWRAMRQMDHPWLMATGQLLGRGRARVVIEGGADFRRRLVRRFLRRAAATSGRPQ